jgi:hypothetical protein
VDDVGALAGLDQSLAACRSLEDDRVVGRLNAGVKELVLGE